MVSATTQVPRVLGCTMSAVTPNVAAPAIGPAGCLWPRLASNEFQTSGVD